MCFLKCESARPPIFTIFDITCVFIKVTLIKSRSHSLRRNNNFFLVSFQIDATWEIEEKYCERKPEKCVYTVFRSSVRFRAKRSSPNGNQCYFVYREALSRFSLAVSPCVTRMDWINMQLLSRNAALNGNAPSVYATLVIVVTRDCIVTNIPVAQGIQNNDRFSSWQ